MLRTWLITFKLLFFYVLFIICKTYKLFCFNLIIDLDLVCLMDGEQYWKHPWFVIQQRTYGNQWRKYQGSTKVSVHNYMHFTKSLKFLQWRSETLDEYFARTFAISNRLTAHGEKMEQVLVVNNFALILSLSLYI